jgi:hypothetical protein
MIHSNTTNGSTTFIDSSASAHTISGYGSIAHSDTQTQGGHSTSIAFTGSGQYLSVPSSADWDFGSGDYTIKFAIYLVSYSDYEEVINRYDASDMRCFEVYIDLDKKLHFVAYPTGTYNGDVDLTSASGLSLNTWHIIAVGRNGANMQMTIDSSNINITAADIFTPSAAVAINIGGISNGTTLLHGYLDDIEILKGVWQP